MYSRSVIPPRSEYNFNKAVKDHIVVLEMQNFRGTGKLSLALHYFGSGKYCFRNGMTSQQLYWPREKGSKEGRETRAQPNP
jgi:hypothetical protein